MFDNVYCRACAAVNCLFLLSLKVTITVDGVTETAAKVSCACTSTPL